MNTIEKQRKHDELVKKTNRQVIIRKDPKTGEEYLSGHCVCPNTWHRVTVVDGKDYFGCNQCGCEAAFIDGKWQTGKTSPSGFISDESLRVYMSGNDFGFGYAEKILFTKIDETEWTKEEMKELDDEINERLH